MTERNLVETGPFRLFVAVELSDELREALARLQTELRSRGLERLRWVRPDAIHLTLKFLGDVPAQRAPAIQEAVGAAVAGSPALRLALGDLGTFGGRRPHVLCVAAAGEVDRLKAVQRRVEEALAGLGFAPEERPFSPHLTLARVPPGTAAALAGRLAQAVAAAASPATAEMEVREVSLMRSILSPSGAVYERLATAALQ